MISFNIVSLSVLVIIIALGAQVSCSHHYIERAGYGYDRLEQDEMKLRIRVLEEHLKMTKQELNETKTRVNMIENALNPGFLQVVYDVLALNKFALSIKELDSKPGKAILYEDPDYQGKELEFNQEINQGPPCVNLGDLEGKVSSIKVSDSCVRLYYERNCEGANEFITPFTTNTTNLGASNDKFKSITGCTPVATD